MRTRLAAVVLVMASMAACHRKTAATPPPLQPVPAAQQTPPPVLPPPPETEGVPLQPPVLATPQQPPPPPPAQPSRPRRASQPAKPAAPAPSQPAAPQAAAQVPQQVPQLGQILTDGERQEHAKAVQAHLAKARAYLAGMRGRAITAEQQSGIARVEGLIRQAEEAGKNDPVSARSLAQRAEVLARDLAK